MSPATEPFELLKRLPSPAEIQQRLGDLVNEERMLRQLLRVAIRAEQQGKRQEGREEPVHV